MSDLDYDPGLLNDFGGGDVGWWQDYIRAEIGRCNDYWRERCVETRPAAVSVEALRELWNEVLELCECFEEDADRCQNSPGYKEYPSAIDYLRGQRSTAKRIRITISPFFKELIDQAERREGS